MGYSNIKKIIIAEVAPIIRLGLIQTLGKISDFRSEIIETDTKENLNKLLVSEYINILFINPTFGGLTHPDDLRKMSQNPDIKIIAIELSKLSCQTLSLYDDHIHVTDDIPTLGNKIKSAYIGDEAAEEKETLSVREKEIVSFVVKGFTNQEIADKLFLSIHTVITHRRNIARKLEIHSATALTIYAIVNNIVNISEIKI